MADDSRSDDAPKAGSTLDLSTGKPPRRRKRKGPLPVVQQTINLSTPKAEAPPPEAPKPTDGDPSNRKKSTSSGGSGRSKRGSAPTSASSSLADLLDPEVLAKLRGDG